jgi:hypothetical protein
MSYVVILMSFQTIHSINYGHRGVNLFDIRHIEKGKYGAMQLNVFKTSMLKFKMSLLF